MISEIFHMLMIDEILLFSLDKFLGIYLSKSKSQWNFFFFSSRPKPEQYINQIYLVAVAGCRARDSGVEEGMSRNKSSIG